MDEISIWAMLATFRLGAAPIGTAGFAFLDVGLAVFMKGTFVCVFVWVEGWVGEDLLECVAAGVLLTCWGKGGSGTRVSSYYGYAVGRWVQWKHK